MSRVREMKNSFAREIFPIQFQVNSSMYEMKFIVFLDRFFIVVQFDSFFF